MALRNDQIAIVHAATASFSELTKVTFENHEEYASKHGYLIRDIELQPGEFTWGKIRALQESFADPSIQRAFWIDADAIFTNFQLSLIEHLPKEKIVVSSDALGPNSGTMWLENCPEVRRLLAAVAKKGPELFEKHAWHEQSTLRLLSFHPPYNKIVHYVEQTRMNSYLHEFHSSENWIVRAPDNYGQWYPGHFILHLAGIANPLRMQILQKILPLIKK